MAALGSTTLVSRIQGFDALAAPLRRPRHLDVLFLVAGCWALLFVAELTGASAALHHHALIEGDLPLTTAIPMFLVGWLVMAAAMMLPASLRAIDALDAGTSLKVSPRQARSAFLATLAVVWIAFGLVAFFGDVGLHHVVDTTPWLAERPWLIESGILALAGGYQLVPLKRRSLAACRHPVEFACHGIGRWHWPTRSRPRPRLPWQLMGPDAPDVCPGFHQHRVDGRPDRRHGL